MSTSHSELAARGAAAEYWNAKLRDLPAHGLPLRPQRSGERREQALDLPETLAASLHRAAGGSEVSAYLLALAAFAALLWRYSESDEVVIAAGTRGFFRQRLDEQTTFRMLLEVLRDELESNLRHQRAIPHYDADVAFSDDRDRAPLHLQVERRRLRIAYDPAALGDALAAQLARHFVTMLNGLLTAADASIAHFALLNDDEMRHLVEDCNPGPIAATSDDDLVTRFERQAALTPDAIAVTCEDRSLTYAELNARADALAQSLGGEEIVAFLLDRSEWLVVAILGIMKSGAAYLPIDPSYPQVRIDHMLADSGARILLRDADVRTASGQRPAASRQLRTIDSTAYIIYTSGSTGVPKGVAVTHRNVVRLFESTQPEYRFGPDDVWTLFHSAAFDFSVWELWGALLHGGRVVVVTADDARIAESFYDVVARERVTVLNQTPSAFRQFDLVDAAKRDTLSLRLVIFGGEALDPASLRGWFDRHGDERPRLVNMYGITETTVFVTWRPLSRADLQAPNVIGMPIPGWQIHLLDRHGNLVPEGVAGEIYVGGEGVALGYLHRPELNAQRFLPDRFSMRGGTLYRSGDLARRLPGNELEYLGRIDQQVKVRGFRIELGEIEQRLLEHPAIPDAAVLPFDGEDGVELAAFLFGAPALRPRELRQRLRESLPAYMVPSQFISVAERPLTSNGKLDHRALLALLAPRAEQTEAPPTPLEETLLAIWNDVLRRSVRRDESFFELGGHSLKAARLIGRIRRELSVEVSLADLFQAPSVSQLARLIEGRARSPFAPIEPLPAASSYELSPAQRRLWVIEQFEQAEAAYNVPAAFLLEGALDVDALQAALRAVVVRHESLRTRFIAVDGEPRQIIGAADFGWALLDANDDGDALRIAKQEAVRRFDLANDPLLRVTLIRLGAERHLLVFVVHHIICDGRSLEIFAREAGEAYAGAEPARPRIQYADFAAWQARLLDGDALAEQRAWWHDALCGELPRIDLPLDFARPAVRTYRGATTTFRVSAAHAKRLDALARVHGLTPAILGLVNVLLHRLTGQDDLIVGHPVTGRIHPDLDEQIGMYVNTLPLRMRVRGDAALEELIAEAAGVFAGAFDHQAYPFDRLVDELRVARDTGRSPLFDVLVVVHDASGAALALDGIRTTPVPLDSGTSKFDLSFYFTQRAGELTCDVEYDTSLFHPASIARWWRCFERILDASAEERVSAIDIVPREERAELLAFERQPRDERTLIALFEEQVDATPDAIAIAPSMTYRALDEQANRIANWLLESGLASPGARIAVRLERSADLIAAILGILKSGAAYVPLDPAYPDARARFVIEDSGAATVITDSQLRLAGSYIATRPRDTTTPDGTAYVIYTSGSTGEPKGVEVAQRSVVNVVRALPLDDSKTLHVALCAPVVFDVSVHQLFAALLGGHTLHVVSESMKRDAVELVRYFEEHEVDVADCTPTLLAMLLECGLAASVHPPKHLIVAGEALPRALVERTPSRVTNAYGPTEACVYATAYEVAGHEPGTMIPIGAPLANVEILVLDGALRLLPRGCIGEICIGGDGLALGYLNRDALTRERFVAHPFRTGERLYRTGDYGRWNAAGALEYLGRRDAQVKVRGHRVELGEVEAALRRHPQVRDAVAVTFGEGVERDLAGYVAAPPSLTPSALKEFLGGIVPDFLIPSRIAVIDALPLTASGKVDRNALPPLDAAPSPHDVLPRTPLEQQIATIWEAVLGRKDLGVRTDFFAAGGQSLRAVQLVARLREATGRAVSLSDVFRFPTIEAQARHIAASGDVKTRPIVPLPPATLYDCSNAQRRMYFLDRTDATGAAYQMPGLFLVEGPLDERRLREACRRVAARHESLRTTFTLLDGEPKQRVSARADVRIAVLDAAIDPEDENACRELIARDVARRFDLERGPLWRITLFNVSRERRLLLFNMHHLIGDGWSVEILVRELAAAYDGAKPEPLPIQYRDYAAWQQDLLASGALDASGAYWHAKLAPPIEALELPADRPRPATRNFAGRVAHGAFAPELIARLTGVAQQHGTTLFAALLTAIKVVLFRWSGQEEIVTGSPVAGREREELEGQIGLYLNTIVMRDRVRGADTLGATLRAVGATVAEAVEHQAYPFDRLVSELGVTRDRSRSPLFDVLVAMQGSPAVELRLGEASVRELPFRGEVSKLDLGFHFVPRHDGSMMLDLEYATALFDASTIERLAGDVVRAAEAIAGDPEQPVHDDLAARLTAMWSSILDESEIEPDDDFFELGGDSLRAMRLLARVERDLGLRISLGDFLLTPTIEGMIALAQPSSNETIPAIPIAEDHELSYAQQRMWLLDRIDTIGSAYDIAAAFAIDGAIDDDALAAALHALFERHESLRTRFITRDDEPRQQIAASELPLRFIDAAEEDVDALLRDELAHRFDLANETLFRVLVIRTDARRIILFHLHHIIADAQSANVLVEELEALYRGETLPPLRIHYKDAAQWLRARVKTADRDYWVAKLAPLPAALELPADFARPSARTFEGALATRALPADLADALRELARERGVTLFVLFAAAVKALLHRYTGEEDIVLGTPVSGRPHADLERQAGLYLDTIALRDEVRAGEPFLDLLDRVHQTTAEAFEHLYPFDKLVGELALPRDTSRSPLFDVFVVHHAGERTTFRLGDAEAVPYALPVRSAKFDLSIHITETDALQLDVEYATDLFTPARIDRLGDHLETLLRSIADDPGQPIGDMEIERVIPSREDGEESLAEDILANIDAVPADTECLVHAGLRLTFGEVRDRANALAETLKTIVRPGDVVAVSLERSEEIPIALLATLYAEGVYTWLDPHLPQARFDLLLRNCDPRALITRDGVMARESSARPLEDAAYLVYTSGSTGTPKGVIATRRCLDNLITWQERELGRGLRSLQFAALGFDVAIQEILFSLASGGTLFIPNEAERRNLTPYLEANAIELVTMPFSALNAWFLGGTGEMSALRHIITSGEQLQLTAEMRRFLTARPDVALHNQYGPSETHVVTSHTLSAARGNLTDLPPIGRPIANTKIRIVDARLQPVPTGIPGELLIGGANVALGYLGHESDRFITHRGERMYRTGDLARWRDDGTIEFLGRRDDQVKIRGFRVEPGEVEHVLRQHPRVADAAVIAVGEHGARELWAWVAGDAGEEELRQFAAASLPDYMVPSRVIGVAELPRTSSGKLDRRALPRPAALERRHDYVAPRSLLEARLVAIWESVLERSPIGVFDDFFTIGGHSLGATRLAARISRELGLAAGLSDVFAHSTVASLAAHLDSAKPASAPIEPVPPADDYALSHAQQRMWVLGQLSGESAAYRIPATIRIRGPLDADAFQRALESLFAAHEVFRTTFVIVDDEPRQRIGGVSPLCTFDLQRIADDDFLLRVDMHHIVTDAWSLELCIRQLVRAYESGAPVPAPRVTYKDYAAWQRALPLDAERAYWHAQLAGLEPLELPADFPRPAVQSFEGRTLTFAIGAETTRRFTDMAARHGSSLFIAFVAAVKTLLHRYSGQRDFAVGSPIAGRTHRDLEDVVGCFVNTLVLRDAIDPDETFARFLARVRETTLAAYEHQAYPFDRLVDEIVDTRDPSRSPLFDVVVAMHNEPPLDVRAGAVSFTEEPLELAFTKFDLALIAHVDDGALNIVVQYATALHSEQTIRRMARHLELLIEAVASDPELALRDIPLVSEDEQRLLMHVTTGEGVPVEPTTIVDAFERVADAHPDRIAVACGDDSLTWRELDARANAIARWLIAEHGVAADSRVAVRVPRSVDLIAAIVGVLKSGGAWVPVETWFPDSRAAMLIEDAQCAAVVTREAIERAVSSCPDTRPRADIAPHHLAYVMFTSGSTGRPKGVMIQHSGVLNLVAGLRELVYGRAGEPLRVAILASVVFDATVQQLFPALLLGHEVHVIDDDTKRDAHELVRWLVERRIDTCDGTPGLFSLMIEGGLARAAHQPRFLLLGGEAFPRALAEEYYANGGNRGSRIINLYGPTECTVESTAYAVDPDAIPPGAHLPIGRPLANQSVWLLDDRSRLLPLGAAGEICIGGPGLARGYFNRDDLTAERFIPHPLIPGERLYRTGDFGRWRNDGALEFLGRRDAQVKVRGYRIELGEVEAALRRCDGVRDAAVVLHESELAAYVAGGDAAQIRTALAQLLPAYMIPTWIVPVDAIPLGASGKIDRRALPPPPAEEAHVPPATEMERAIAAIWSEVLGIPRIGATTNFFALGGNSIRAIQVLSRIRRDHGLHIPIAAMFTRPTVRALAQFNAPQSPLPELRDEGVSAAQRRLWIIDRMIGPSALYNVPAAIRIRGAFDPGAFDRAVQAVVDRHESLRMAFRNAGVLAARPGDVPPQVVTLDLTMFDEATILRIVAEDANRPFDLEHGPLFRVTLFRCAADEWIALFNAHHIILDGWSAGILKRELFALYRGETLPPLAPAPRNADTLEEKEWWLARLAPPVAALDLPTDRPHPPVRTYAGAKATFAVDAQLARSLAALGRAHGATLFMTLLACVKVLLHRYSGEEDIIVGTPVAGRVDPRLEDKVGLFVNTLALRDRVRAGDRFDELLRQVSANAAEAFDRQTVPFDALVDALQLERDPSRNALFDVFLSLQHDHAAPIDIPGATVTPLDPGTTTSKFDLSFFFVERDGALELQLEYSTELYDPPRIERLFGHLRQLFASAVADPRIPIADLRVIPDEERAQLLAVHAAPHRAATVLDEFESIAARYPDRIAVVCEGREWTYRQLDECSNRIAAHLSCEPESRVALRVTRSEKLIAAMLAVLKCGAAYVPIDPQWPEDRAQFVIDDCECTAVLDDAAFRVVRASGAPPEARPRRAPLHGNSLAYVLYTSGSTGTPKGVMIEHHSLSNLIHALDPIFDRDPLRVALVASAAFDVSGGQIWGALVNGHTLHIVPDELKRDPAALVRSLEETRIDVADMTPSLFSMMLESGLCESAWRPLHLLIAGEALPLSLVQRFHAGNRETRIENLYGPTECCIYATGCTVDASSATIGRPLANQHVLLLDDRLQLVPFGCIGEICIGGEGVARGYWKRDALTAERFPAHPFRDGERIYRTGDYGRWRNDGHLEFLGRRDGQVKLRGYRIELGEIESALLAIDGIEQAAVVLKDGAELAAWIVSRSDVDPSALRNALARTLPAYMVPARVIRVDALPLSTSGKLDRGALASLEGSELRDAYTAPSSDGERDLAAAWQEVLGRDHVGVDENYFHLGGDSIRAIQIVARLAERGWKLDVRTIFRYPAIRALAPQLRRAHRVIEEDGGDAPILPAQAWFFEAPGPEPHHFNQSLLLRAGERLDSGQFERAVQQMLARHRVLQKNAAFRCLDVETADRLTEIAEQEQRALNIDEGPLFRAVLFRMSDADRVLLVVHHLVVDGVSWRILLDDLRRAYDGVALSPRTDSLAAWSRALHAWNPDAQLPYWRGVEQTHGDDPPRDFDAARGTSGAARGISIQLAEEQTRALEQINAAWHTHHGDLLLTALALACNRWYGARTLRVTIEGHGREPFGPDLDVSATVGWFTSIFPHVVELKNGVVQTLRSNKEALRRVPNGGIGYGVLRYLRKTLGAGEEPRFVLNYLGQFEPRNVGFTLANESPGRAISPRAPLRHDISISAIVAEDRLRITIEYDTARYAGASIERFAVLFEETLATLAVECDRDAALPTPSDFTYADGFALEELDELLGEGGGQ